MMGLMDLTGKQDKSSDSIALHSASVVISLLVRSHVSLIEEMNRQFY